MRIDADRAAGRVEFLGVDFDTLAMPALVDRVDELAWRGGFSYLVTPNVDHVVRLHDVGGAGDWLWRCYRDATLCVCDSRILSFVARLRGRAMPAVPGSDLVARLLDEKVSPGDRVALIGGRSTTLQRLERQYPGVLFSQHIPPMGLLRDEAALAAVVTYVVEHPAQFVLLAVGSPQQEVLAHRLAASGAATGIALCIGASVDFIVGDEQRAPRLIQRLSLEWLFRLAMSPKRLWRRYLVEGPKIFLLAARWRPVEVATNPKQAA